MSENESYAMTERGWDIAADVWERFCFQGEDIESVAASYDLDIDHITILMSMAFTGGLISLD